MSKKYLMDYIPDKTLYTAVMYARDLMRKGISPRIANTRAAKYYKVSSKDVAHHTGQAAGRIRHKKSSKTE